MRPLRKIRIWGKVINMTKTNKIICSILMFGLSLAASLLGSWLLSVYGQDLAWHMQMICRCVFTCQFVMAVVFIINIFRMD